MYDLYSDFDMHKHKQQYIHYLEAILFPDGHVEYAVPSHQEKLIAICIKQLNVTRDQLSKMCPENYYFDFMIWLCNICRCVALYTTFYQKSDTYPLTKEQIKTLTDLKSINVYEGDL